MIYRIKQKVWSMTDRFSVFDESGTNLLYTIKSTSFWSSANFILQDNKEVEKLKATEKGIFRRKYILQFGDQTAIVQEKFSFFFPKIVIIQGELPPIEIDGSLLAHEFVIKRQENILASISKKAFSWTDSYGLTIEPGQTDELFIGIVAIIDFWFFSKRSES